MKIELSQSEVDLLVQVIEEQLEGAGSELRRTEQMAYHDALKSKKQVLEKLLQQLRGAK